MKSTIAMTPVSSWGRRGRHPHRVLRLLSPSQARETVPASSPGLAGLARAEEAQDAMLEFDEQTGVLRCEAGVQLGEIQRLFAPQGWMLPVTPGEQHVSVAGAITNDVHGKNHHVAGTFGRHVDEIELLRTDGEVVRCGPDLRKDWFSATVGGLGLTGVILSAAIRLERVQNPYLDVENIEFGRLSEFFELTRESDHPYTVSWIDVSTDGGRRGVFSRAGRATAEQGEAFESAHPGVARLVRSTGPEASRAGALRVPITPPVSAVNRLTLPLLNRCYFGLQRRGLGRSIVDYGRFFYPLNAIEGWNRMYGPRGFYQFQSAVPWAGAEEATAEMLHVIARSGEGSFLSVLKGLGDVPSPGILSYPRPGVNFTLDFPDRGESTRQLLDRLERIAVEAGGRLYPAKDARMSRETFRAGYPGLDTFIAYRDPGITSDLARRLLDD